MMNGYPYKIPSELSPVEAMRRVRKVQDYIESQVPVPEGESMWPSGYNGSWNQEGIYEMRFPIVTGKIPQESNTRCSLLWTKGTLETDLESIGGRHTIETFDYLVVNPVDMELTDEMRDKIAEILGIEPDITFHMGGLFW